MALEGSGVEGGCCTAGLFSVAKHINYSGEIQDLLPRLGDAHDTLRGAACPSVLRPGACTYMYTEQSANRPCF